MRKALFIILLFLSASAFGQLSPSAIRRIDAANVVFGKPLSAGQLLYNTAENRIYGILRGVPGTASLQSLTEFVDYVEIKTSATALELSALTFLPDSRYAPFVVPIKNALHGDTVGIATVVGGKEQMLIYGVSDGAGGMISYGVKVAGKLEVDELGGAALSGIRDTLAFHRDSLASTYDSLALHRDTLTDHAGRLVALEDSVISHRTDIGKLQDSITNHRDTLWNHSDRLVALERDTANYLKAEIDPVWAQDSANVLHWADTIPKIATKYDLALIESDLNLAGIRDTLAGKQERVIQKTADSTLAPLYPMDIAAFNLLPGGRYTLVNLPIYGALPGDTVEVNFTIGNNRVFSTYVVPDGAGGILSKGIGIHGNLNASGTGRFSKLGIGADPGSWTAYLAGNTRINDGLYVFSTEAGKTNYRIVTDASDADNLRIFGYDLDGSAYKPLRIGGMASALGGLTIDADAIFSHLSAGGLKINDGYFHSKILYLNETTEPTTTAGVGGFWIDQATHKAYFKNQSGTNYDLTAGGSAVTSVSASSPLASSGGQTPTLSISQAGSGSSGYLSSTDWNTFNNKVSFPGFGTSGSTAAYGNHTHAYDNYQHWMIGYQTQSGGGGTEWVDSGEAFKIAVSSPLSLTWSGTGSTGDPFTASIGLDLAYKTVVSISNSQLDNAYSSPVEIIPAPGSNKIIQLISVAAQLNFTAPALSDQDLYLYCSGVSSYSYNYQAMIEGYMINNGGSCQWPVPLNTNQTISFNSNSALLLKPAADITSGGGSLKLHIIYRIVDMN